MKQFALGLVTILVLVLVGIAGFRGASSLMSRLIPRVSPSPTPAGFEIASPTPTPTGSTAPTTSIAPTQNTTKGGLPVTTGGTVKGISTSAKTTVTTTSTKTITHVFLTLIKTSECKSFVSEIKDISGPLTIKYSVKDGYKATVTAWKDNGEEVISQREITGSGDLKRIEGLSYLKLQSQPASCSSTSDTWLTITAER